MKIKPSNIKILQSMHSSKGQQVMQDLTDDSAKFINKFIKDLTDAKDHNEALNVLFNNVDNGNLQAKNGVLYKHGEYYIQNLFKTTGMPYKNTLEQLGRTKTSIAPELVKSIEKDGEMFIISRIKGTKTGDLIPLDSVRDKVPKENLLAAFHDLQQVTKAGITDNRILRSPDLWFVSPDDLKVVLPEWSQTRPLLPNEGKDVLDRYYKTLFNK